MEKIASVLYIVAIIAFVLGLFKPDLVIRWDTEKTRKKVFIYFGVPFLLLGAIVGSLNKEKATTTSVSPKVGAEIGKQNPLTIEEHFKNATYLSPSLGKVAEAAERFGFVHHFSRKSLLVEKSNFTDHSYFKEYIIKSNGEKAGKGDVISVKVDHDNHIIEATFRIGKTNLDWENFSKEAQAGDVEANNNYYGKKIKAVAQTPTESAIGLINLIFEKDSSVFFNKLNEISSASQSNLISMYIGKGKFKHLGAWQTSFSAGGKKVELAYVVDTIVANVKTEETAKLFDYYFDNKNRFEK